jgi:laminin beta 1
LPCNCASGNSYTNLCDQETGQCSCKPHTFGRRCNYFEEGFFCPALDHIVLEAENAKRVNNHSALHEMIDYIDSEILSWTGMGYLKIYEGGIIKFNYTHNYSIGLYDIMLRYQASIYDWRNINLKIRNMGPVFHNSTLLRNKKDNTKKTCQQLVRKQKNVEENVIFLNQSNSFIYINKK